MFTQNSTHLKKQYKSFSVQWWRLTKGWHNGTNLFCRKPVLCVGIFTLQVPNAENVDLYKSLYNWQPITSDIWTIQSWKIGNKFSPFCFEFSLGFHICNLSIKEEHIWQSKMVSWHCRNYNWHNRDQNKINIGLYT